MCKEREKGAYLKRERERERERVIGRCVKRQKKLQT